MKKIILPLLQLLLFASLHNNAFAQNIFPATGRAGIYTINPGASLHVRGGARIGTLANYLNVDSATGNLSFVGTSAYRVAGNKYAFQYSGNTNFGLFFNSTSSLYEFRNGSAVPVFSVNANNGNSVFNGTLKVGAYTLPATDGGSGQVLKTNGAGALAWSNDNASGGGSGWLLTGNAGTNSSTNFIGTTDPQSLVLKVNNQQAGLLEYSTCCSGKRNTAFGLIALNSNTTSTTGTDNTAIGYGSLYTNTTGNFNAALGKYALFNNNADNNTALGFNAMFFNTSGVNNTASGSVALQNNTSGQQNTATGYAALYSNNNGSYNSAYGTAALNSNIGGNYNTANGAYSLYLNSSGSNNTASGYQALYNNTADENTATGAYSLLLNTSGAKNTATGYSALNLNSTGNYNTATGNSALNSNSTGSSNTAIGYLSLFSNAIGSDNTAVGVSALEKGNSVRSVAIGNYALKTDYQGSENTALGYGAMRGNNPDGFGHIYGSTAVGSYALYNAQANYDAFAANWNTAVGSYSLYSNTYGTTNTAIGYDALYNNTTGRGNIAVGSNVLRTNTTGIANVAIDGDVNSGDISYSTMIGANSLATASQQIRIGSVGAVFDPTSIGGKVSWSTLSDGRAKKNIKENVPGLVFINKLKAITYNIDNDAINKIVQRPAIKDKDGKQIKPAVDAASKAEEQIVHTGFIAQDVEKAAKSLNYDFNGVDAAKNDKDLYGLRYAEFVVPLVKAVQELSAKNDALQKQIDDLKAIVLSNNSSSTQNLTIAVLSNASLEQNIPNPFTHTTTIAFNLPQKFTSAQIVITDNNGKTIKAINISGTGKGSLNVDAATLASGAYNYSLIVDGKLIGTKQMILAK